MRRILKFILKILAKRVIARYKPAVIGVTGSVGKTLAKEAIYAVLSRRFHVRKNEENFNNEIGVPMTILGISPKSSSNPKSEILNPKKIFKPQILNSKFKQAIDLLKGAWLAYGFFKADYPEMLVLEMAADRPGDIDYLVDIAMPSLGVVTAVGETPVHVEFYSSPQAVAREKSRLIERLPPDGLAVLNQDDQTVLDMKDKSKAKVVTFGFSKESHLRISDISYFVSEGYSPVTSYQLPVTSSIAGLSFKINHGSTFIPAKINGMIGTHQLYGVMAAVAVGTHFGLNLIEIANALENIELPKHRMNLARGVKNSWIIDDTYNASPLSTHAALDTLRDFAAASKKLGHCSRRIAVLGDMKELGKYEIEAHRAIGNLAAERCDILITIGAAGKLIADSAANQMPKENIFSFSTSAEAAPKVQEIIQEGDIILVKGSRSMEMEKIVEEISNAPNQGPPIKVGP